MAIKRLMCFSPPTKCIYDNVISNILHKIWSESLRQSFSLL